VIEKTITIFRNKKPKNLKFGLLGFLGFFKKPKKPRFFKSDFYSPRWQWTSPQHANVIVQRPLVSSGVVFAACVKAGDAHF